MRALHRCQFKCMHTAQRKSRFVRVNTQDDFFFFLSPKNVIVSVDLGAFFGAVEDPRRAHHSAANAAVSARPRKEQLLCWLWNHLHYRHDVCKHRDALVWFVLRPKCGQSALLMLTLALWPAKLVMKNFKLQTNTGGAQHTNEIRPRPQTETNAEGGGGQRDVITMTDGTYMFTLRDTEHLFNIYIVFTSPKPNRGHGTPSAHPTPSYHSVGTDWRA